MCLCLSVCVQYAGRGLLTQEENPRVKRTPKTGVGGAPQFVASVGPWTSLFSPTFQVSVSSSRERGDQNKSSKILSVLSVCPPQGVKGRTLGQCSPSGPLDTGLRDGPGGLPPPQPPPQTHTHIHTPHACSARLKRRVQGSGGLLGSL